MPYFFFKICKHPALSTITNLELQYLRLKTYLSKTYNISELRYCLSNTTLLWSWKQHRCWDVTIRNFQENYKSHCFDQIPICKHWQQINDSERFLHSSHWVDKIINATRLLFLKMYLKRMPTTFLVGFAILVTSIRSEVEITWSSYWHLTVDVNYRHW